MIRFMLVILVLILLVNLGCGLNPKICQSTPREKHCLIEYSVKERWPHQVRFVYNWYTRTCFEIRWSDNCPPVLEPPTSNNFSTERECLEQCAGWA